NTHARFLFRDASDWRDGIQYSHHSDYPLLTPATTARLWRFAGEEIPDAGAVLGLFLSLFGVACLPLTISLLRVPLTGTVLGLVLVGMPAYLDHATSQYADVPLSFFILSTIALICLYEEQSDKRMLMLAGFTAGCAGWTKNEGLLFIAATYIAFL